MPLLIPHCCSQVTPGRGVLSESNISSTRLFIGVIRSIDRDGHRTLISEVCCRNEYESQTCRTCIACEWITKANADVSTERAWAQSTHDGMYSRLVCWLTDSGPEDPLDSSK